MNYPTTLESPLLNRHKAKPKPEYCKLEIRFKPFRTILKLNKTSFDASSKNI